MSNQIYYKSDSSKFFAFNLAPVKLEWDFQQNIEKHITLGGVVVQMMNPYPESFRILISTGQAGYFELYKFSKWLSDYMNEAFKKGELLVFKDTKAGIEVTFAIQSVSGFSLEGGKQNYTYTINCIPITFKHLQITPPPMGKIKSESQTPSTNNTYKKYVVKKGDTLWDISQRAKVPLDTIKQLNWNMLKKRKKWTLIYPGDIILLPSNAKIGK